MSCRYRAEVSLNDQYFSTEEYRHGNGVTGYIERFLWLADFDYLQVLQAW
jgi:hypothetical protein